MSELIPNKVDPDQTPRSAASDLGLLCLPMSLLWDTKGQRYFSHFKTNGENLCEKAFSEWNRFTY